MILYDKLYSVDQFRDRLKAIEPTEIVDCSGAVVDIAPAWHLDREVTDDSTVGIVGRGSRRYDLTRAALFKAAKFVGLRSRKDVQRLPGHVLAPLVQFGLDAQHAQAFVTDNVVTEFNTATTEGLPSSTVFNSSLKALQETAESLGFASSVMVDPKSRVSQQESTVRLVLPDFNYLVEGVSEDAWSVGMTVKSSLVSPRISVQGYLFRWVCTNGATVSKVLGSWGKSISDPEVLIRWLEDVVPESVGASRIALGQVSELATKKIQGSVSDYLEHIFKEYSVPPAYRDTALTYLLDVPEITAYEVMQALTQAANQEDVSAADVDKLLSIGGELLTEHPRCDSCHSRL